MINVEQVILARLFRELNGENIEEFESRVVLQKKVYLLQACDLNLGYGFYWEEYGPFSSDLAEDLRSYEDNREEVESRAERLKLTRRACEAVEKVKAILPRHPEMPLHEWLEIVASLHFVAVNYLEMIPLPDKSSAKAQEAIDLLVSRKPHLTGRKDQIEEAWDLLRGDFSVQTTNN